MRKIIQGNEERPVFQLLFLKYDDDQSVEVEEVSEIDFSEVKERLEHGESVFITAKHKEKAETSPDRGQYATEP